MFGAIWAEKAWGRFWGWDTKEVWTFIIWVVYVGYLHARATRGWTGTRAASLSIVGYLCVVFNFTIVNREPVLQRPALLLRPMMTDGAGFGRVQPVGLFFA